MKSFLILFSAFLFLNFFTAFSITQKVVEIQEKRADQIEKIINQI